LGKLRLALKIISLSDRRQPLPFIVMIWGRNRSWDGQRRSGQIRNATRWNQRGGM